MRKRVWVNTSDIVLVGLRDFQDGKADVILKYSPDEAKNLKIYGELPADTRINDQAAIFGEEDAEDVEFDFDAI
jgi:translation initiation factor 1A